MYLHQSISNSTKGKISYYEKPIGTSYLDRWLQSSQILSLDDPTWRTADTAEAEIISPNDMIEIQQLAAYIKNHFLPYP